MNISSQHEADKDLNDEALMLAYAGGDMAAFETLYQKHKGSLYRYFIRQIPDRTLAEDLYQELWNRIIKASASYKVTAKWTTWVYTMAHNLVIDHVRALKPVDPLEDDDDVEGQTGSLGNNDPETLQANEQLADQLKRCIQKLPQAQQEVFLLNEETGMSLKAISEVVSISLEAAKSRLRYARSQLQTCLSEAWQYINGESGGRS